MTLVHDSDQPSQPAPKAGGCRPRAITVLYVEPLACAVEAARELLEDEGFNVLAVGNCSQARRAYRHHAGIVDVLVTELRLPDGDAGELARELRRTDPELQVIFASTYAADEPEVQRALAERGSTYLEKVLDVERLARTIRVLVEGSNSASAHHRSA